MFTIKAGIIKRLHVDKRIVAQNNKQGKDEPAITIQYSGRSEKTRYAKVLGPSELVQPGRQLSCGARIWLETKAEVEFL